MTQRNNVCTPEPLDRGTFQLKLAAAWSRVCASMGSQSAMATKMGLTDTSSIKRGTGIKNLPEAHTIFNSLCADETALNEILREYGFGLRKLAPEAANDFKTLSGLCDTAAEYAEALKDGRRVHPETLRIAEKLRPHMSALNALLAEADELRGVA